MSRAAIFPGFIAGAVAAGALAAYVPAAGAIPIVGSFDGTITSGFDAYDAFGVAGGDLTGQRITGALSYDTDNAPAASAPGVFESSGAGSWLAMSITINDVRWSFDFFASDPSSTTNTFMTVADGPDAFTAGLTRTPVAATGSEQIDFLVADDVADFIGGLGLPQTLSWAYSGQAVAQGGFFSQFDCGALAGCASHLFTGTFSVSSLTLRPAVAVAEPATAGLLIFGLAGLWLGSHRQRKARATLLP
jgi:hypothetical protein